jgi:DNA-binding beta-propeller fold protein YncE
MQTRRVFVILPLVLLLGVVRTPARAPSSSELRAVQLDYRVVPDFLKLPSSLYFSEVSGVALNSKGHIFVFQRGVHPLVEFDKSGNFVRTIGEGLFTRPHGLRIDKADNLWVTDNGAHFVLKLTPEGQISMVLGQKDYPGTDHGHFDGPDDVAFGKSGEIYVADGEGNSRVVEFDGDGHFLKEWGRKGSGEGEFRLPHTIATDAQGLVYVGDRENARIQVFDSEGKFLAQWRDVGHPYGIFVSPDQHIWMADAEASRVLEIDRSGRVLGSFGISGRGVGQLAGAHALGVTAQKEIFVAEVFNWRVEKFIPAGAQATADPSFDSDRSSQVSGSVGLSPEMQKLSDAFVGKWKVTESFEVSASMQGKTRQGTASFRLGPGASLIEDYQSNGSAGPLSFLGLLWWDPSGHVYRLLTCANNDGCHPRGSARWEGNKLVNSWEEQVDGKPATFKDSFVDILPSSFRLVSEGTLGGKTIWRVITKYQRLEEAKQ